MPALTIPPENRPGLAKLQNLTAQQIAELVAALSNAPVKFYRSDLADLLVAQVKSIDEESLRQIIDTVASLEFVRATADVSIDQFLEDLNAAIERQNLEPISADGRTVVERVRQLIQLKSLGIPAKGRTLLLEGKTLCRTRVITDIRPVFDYSDVPTKPDAALIVHNLRISYHDGGSAVQEFIVTLDSNELDLLIDTLGRAKIKEKALETILEASNTPYLKIE